MAGALLALALLMAQTGAIVHGYAHLGSGGLQNTPATAGAGCAVCLSFAPLLAAAGGRGNALSVAPRAGGASYRTPVALLVGPSPRHTFLSRAPPALA